MSAQSIIVKRSFLAILCVAFALSVGACGKKPSKLPLPDETKSFPTQYPTSR